MKRPSFQLYPADWRKDAALQSCSLAARGLWFEMICIAHECEPYGSLRIGASPMTAAQIARLAGESAKKVSALLSELENAGVFSRDSVGAIYSRRMVKDERLRNVRAEAGRLGGNPNLLGKKVNQADNPGSNQQTSKSQPLLSSSSASALPLPTNVGNGADEPPAADLLGDVSIPTAAILDPVKLMFDGGVELLAVSGVDSVQARKIIGGLRSKHGDTAVLLALTKAREVHPSEPLEWLHATVPAMAAKRESGSGRKQIPDQRESYGETL